MTRSSLVHEIFAKQSYLCVGLDTDPQKLPKHLPANPEGMLAFNKAIVDATRDHCVAYKINTAFYEALGAKGWEVLEETAAYIPSTHFKIADAKRGDIGNTSAQYAKAFFETLNFDALTVAPYMGQDSLRPFLEYKNKWTIVLGLTSNAGARDFELQTMLLETENLDQGVHTLRQQTQCLYETVLEKVSRWGSTDSLMFVIGATNPAQFQNIRRLTPNHFYLVPGIGTQGGSLQAVSETAMTADCGLLVNASRAIIFASAGEDFAEVAAQQAKEYAAEMAIYLKQQLA